MCPYRDVHRKHTERISAHNLTCFQASADMAKAVHGIFSVRCLGHRILKIGPNLRSTLLMNASMACKHQEISIRMTRGRGRRDNATLRSSYAHSHILCALPQRVLLCKGTTSGKSIPASRQYAKNTSLR